MQGAKVPPPLRQKKSIAFMAGDLGENEMPTGGSVASGSLQLSSMGNNITTDVSSALESTANQLSHDVQGTSWLEISSQGSKQNVEIPLKIIFLHVLGSLGIINPQFTNVHFSGTFQVHIQFKSELPCARIPAIKSPRISGDVCPSLELAEASAIKKAFEHLDYMHNVVVVDLSTHKIGLLNIRCRRKYMHLLDGISCVENMLAQWNAGCDLLWSVEKVAYNNVRPGAVGLLDEIYGSYLGKFREMLDQTYRGSLLDTREFGTQLKALIAEKMNYQESNRQMPYTGSKAFMVHGNFHEVDILAWLLDWMNFEEPEYASTINDDELYEGAVLLTILDTQQISQSGTIAIAGYCPKGTLLDANNSAAREAILYLEKEFNLEVVDYNHSEKIVLEAEIAYLEDLYQRVLFLGATVKQFWANKLDKLKSTADASKDFPDDNDFINKCVAQLKAAETKFSSLFEAATRKFDALK